MKTQPAISIVVPAYNEESLIGKCLTSLKNQEVDFPYEIIVVNNNSTDKTAEIARSFHVQVITEPMQSVVSARQRGLMAAKGDIVAGADCDCEYPSHWLRTILRHYDNPQVVAVGGPALAAKNPLWAHLIYKIGFRYVEFWYKLTKRVLYLGGFNLSFRRKEFLKLGGYNTYLDFGGDELDVLSRLKQVGTIVFDPQAYMHVSLRRYRVGFVKWLFVHCLYYYVLNYWLSSIFKRPIIRARPVRNI